MKVEYFAEGSDDCPLVLLYGADPKETIVLAKALNALSKSGKASLPIHDLPGISSVDGCQLFAALGSDDVGVTKIQDSNVFECSLRAESWQDVIELLEPFCDPQELAANSFQYLNECSDIRLLISTSRMW
jgi:hypothetical protein